MPAGSAGKVGQGARGHRRSLQLCCRVFSKNNRAFSWEARADGREVMLISTLCFESRRNVLQLRDRIRVALDVIDHPYDGPQEPWLAHPAGWQRTAPGSPWRCAALGLPSLPAVSLSRVL